MADTIRETILNLKDEIQKYAATKNHTHNDIWDYFNDFWNQILEYLNQHYYDKTTSDENFAPYQHNATTTKHGAASASKYGHTKVAEVLTANEQSPVQGKAIVSYINEALKNIKSDTFSNPTKTETKINYLVQPGYWMYIGEPDVFSCLPDTIQYKNGLITVEKQSNHIIQTVYSTSWSSVDNIYKLDGRQFIRHGYITSSNGQNISKWYPWHVKHLPWRKRNDLLLTRGKNVQGTFDIYEHTAGYTFRWIQNYGNDQRYVLHVPQYSYASVYTFKTLPIYGPYVFGNLIGHMDIKITNSDFKIRSINRKGEHIIGMDETYFVPRNN